jgi:demethylsterigmatocystin 6-O-methyltransferase
MESPLNQIREIYTKANASERHKIQDQIRSLQDELYTDWEVLFGQAIGVSPRSPIFPSSKLT